MQIIHDAAELEKAKRAIHLERFMDSRQLPCSVRIYEKGELLASPDEPSRYLLLGISGSVQVYDLNANSGITPIDCMEEAFLIGDMEFCGESRQSYYVEALTRVSCLAFELSVCGPQLNQDVRFLHVVLQSMKAKLIRATTVGNVSEELEERLLRYMKIFCPDQRIEGVGKASIALHCSRRQMQRVLADLCGKGILEKEKKGVYRLQKCDTMMQNCP